MSILFASSKAEDFITGCFNVTTANGAIDPNYSDTSIRIYVASEYGNSSFEGPLIPRIQSLNTGKLWLHTRLFTSGNLSDSRTDGYWFSFYDSNDNLVGRLDHQDGRARTESYGNSSSTLGANVIIGSSQTVTFDISIEVTTTETIVEFYYNDVLSSTSTISNTVSNFGPATKVVMDFLDLGFGTQYGDMFMTEVIITQDEPTIGWRLATLKPNQNGFYNEWSNDYVSISDNNTETSIYTALPNQKQSWMLSDYLGSTVLLDVRAVLTSFVGTPSAEQINNFNPLLRISGSDYEGSTKAFVTDTPYACHIFELNPHTGINWTFSDINALETGVRSL